MQVFQDHQWPPTAYNPLGEASQPSKRTRAEKSKEEAGYVARTTWAGGVPPKCYQPVEMTAVTEPPPKSKAKRK